MPTVANVVWLITLATLEYDIARPSFDESHKAVYATIYKLRRATQLLAPGRDFTWLSEIENDLALMMQPKSRHYHHYACRSQMHRPGDRRHHGAQFATCPGDSR